MRQAKDRKISEKDRTDRSRRRLQAREAGCGSGRCRLGRAFSSLLILLSILAAAVGCGKEQPDQTKTDAPKQHPVSEAIEEAGRESEAAPEEVRELAAVVSDTREEMRWDGEILLLTMQVNDITVSIPDSPQAELAVNDFFKEREAAFLEAAREYASMAKEEYRAMQKQQAEAENGQEDGAAETEEPFSWHGYGLGREYTVKRVDERMICITEDGYEYTGGAHPNSFRVAYNFDTRTGERLSLSAVASDLDEIQAESIRYLGEMLPESEYGEALFSDYANHLADILTDSTWYTDEAGFHIICNEGIITPHAAGILDFLLPYGEVDVIRSRYEPAGEAQPADH